LWQPERNRGSGATLIFNAASQEGFGFYQVTQSKGKRHSAAAAYLHPARARKNFDRPVPAFMSLGSPFEGKRAVDCQLSGCNSSTQERAEREIILCGGAIGSPQLLMLSGVGPASSCGLLYSGGLRSSGRGKEPARPSGNRDGI